MESVGLTGDGDVGKETRSDEGTEQWGRVLKRVSLVRNAVGFPASYVGAKWPTSVGAKSGVALSTSVQDERACKARGCDYRVPG